MVINHLQVLGWSSKYAKQGYVGLLFGEIGVEHHSRAAPNLLDRLRLNKKTMQVVPRVVEMLRSPWTGWWFHFFNVHPDAWGKWSNFDEDIFQRGWNHKLAIYLQKNEWCWKKKPCVGFPGNHETWAQTTIAWCHFGLTQGRRENTARLSWLCGDWTRQAIRLLTVFSHSIRSGSVVDMWMFQVCKICAKVSRYIYIHT